MKLVDSKEDKSDTDSPIFILLLILVIIVFLLLFSCLGYIFYRRRAA